MGLEHRTDLTSRTCRLGDWIFIDRIPIYLPLLRLAATGFRYWMAAYDPDVRVTLFDGVFPYESNFDCATFGCADPHMPGVR